MPNANHPRITLEFEAGADPIRGNVEHPDGSRQPFWGWLELIEEVRRVAVKRAEWSAQPTLPDTAAPPEPDVRARRPKPRTTTREEP